jgi:hypothetical protein
MSESDKLLSQIKFAVDHYDDDEDDDDDDNEELLEPSAVAVRSRSRERFEARAAERLSIRLLAVTDDDSDEEDRIVRESLQLGPSTAAPPALSGLVPRVASPPMTPHLGLRQSRSMATLRTSTSLVSLSTRRSLSSGKLDALLFMEQAQPPHKKAERGVWFMATVAVSVLVLVIMASAIGVAFVGPPNRK